MILQFSLLPISSAQSSFALSNTEEVIQNALKIPEDEVRSELLVLQFGSSGMTESAAKTFSNMIAQNLSNTNRFQITTLDEAEKIIEQEAPFLLPCFEIGCGIQMGKILGSERVLSGHIQLDARGDFILSVKMVNVIDNTLEFEDRLRFTDKNIDQRFYLVANRIARSTPLVGQIIDANNRLAIIALGERDGLRVGDQLVIYKRDRIETRDFEQSQVRIQRQNIGILNITQVGDRTSQGIYFQSIETPQPKQFVTSYLDKRKQVQLIDTIRKELDTHQRNVYEITKSVQLSPVQLEDQELKKWIRKVRLLEEIRDQWYWIMVGSGGASAFFISQFKSGDDLKVIAALGALGYSSFEYFTVKNRLSTLVDEGRYRGYLELKIGPDLGSVGLGYRFDF
ncbi:MAG: hypothetical protein COB67_12940 [SAR324 cluster bacterium]|uniref:Flagellar assembly protein T C-terminal domain-containing protein n=1 Tax=SAR324 cluster bacterium TaxID=2024889 RepID=A0A2A4SPK1_9DELT|nr:MAG: hypothetical protein COB67_12940 [SAR324 cluster bacterium]